MSVSRYPQITEELLSAYLDNTVSAEDRRLIEHAVSVDPRIAWQLESLRQTVELLHSLPAVALPRTFTLDRAMLTQKLAAEQAQNARRQIVQQTPVGVTWWQRWLTVWQSGGPYLRNGTMIAILLLVVLVAGNRLFAPTARPADRTATTTTTASADVVPTPAAVAVVLTQQQVGEQAAPAGETAGEAEGEAAGTTDSGQVPTAEKVAKVPATEPTATTLGALAVQNPVPANSPATDMAMTTAAQGAAEESGESAADSSVLRSPALPAGRQGMPGDDAPDLVPAAPAGVTVEGYGVPPAAQSAPQESALATAIVPVPATPTMITPAAIDQPSEATALVENSEVLVAASVLTLTTAGEPVATPTMTATATVTPTSTMTATATITTTVTPTVTQISQGTVPPQIQAMQVSGNMVNWLQTLLTQLTATIALTLSLLWWRSQTA